MSRIIFAALVLFSLSWCTAAGEKRIASTKKTAVSEAKVARGSLERQKKILATGSLPFQQRALRRLAQLPGADVDALLSYELDQLEKGTLPLTLWLDVLEAVEKRSDPALQERLAARERRLAGTSDPMKRWLPCLEGGNPDEGRSVFAERQEAGCIRCHRVGGEGGSIGPDLSGLHQRAERIAILESIVEPNNSIVPGYRHLAIKLKSGEEVSGILSHEGADFLRLVSVADGSSRTVQTTEIAGESALPSPMPPGLGVTLGRRAIRDLVEYLVTHE